MQKFCAAKLLREKINAKDAKEALKISFALRLSRHKPITPVNT
jgi:hypothetical protein